MARKTSTTMARKHRLTVELAIEAGMHPHAVARRIGTSERRVRRLLRVLGVAVRDEDGAKGVRAPP